jgi:hypothetical protein
MINYAMKAQKPQKKPIKSTHKKKKKRYQITDVIARLFDLFVVLQRSALG